MHQSQTLATNYTRNKSTKQASILKNSFNGKPFGNSFSSKGKFRIINDSSNALEISGSEVAILHQQPKPRINEPQRALMQAGVSHKVRP